MSVACTAVPYFSTLPQKGHDFRKEVNEHQMCGLIFSTTWSETFFLLRRNERDMIINVHRSLCNAAVILVRLNLKFLDTFSKNLQIPNFMKIRPVAAELLQADRQT